MLLPGLGATPSKPAGAPARDANSGNGRQDAVIFTNKTLTATESNTMAVNTVSFA
jgi:hypothetical protein